MNPQIQQALIPNQNRDCGWANGYIGVPKGHPWFGKDYSEIDVRVHGGLTYSEKQLPLHNPQEDSEWWWLGFDTRHWGDNALNQDVVYCINQLNSLTKQTSEILED